MDDGDGDGDEGDIVSVEVVSKKGKLAKEGGSRQCWRGLRGTGEVIRDTPILHNLDSVFFFCLCYYFLMVGMEVVTWTVGLVIETSSK